MKLHRFKLLTFLIIIATLYMTIDVKPYVRTFQRNKIVGGLLDISTMFKTYDSIIQPINILTIMTSLEDTKFFPLQLKSILYYRSSPVVLHLFLNSDLQERVIETLLSTWPADQVYYEIYRLEETDIQVTLPVLLSAFKRLPDFSKKVVYLSPKIIFTSNIMDWMPECENIYDCATLYIDDTPCHSNKAKCDEVHLAYLNLEEEQYYLEQNFTTVTFPSDHVQLLPCHLSPFSSQILKNESNRCYDYASTVKPTSIYVIINDFVSDSFTEENHFDLIIEVIRSIDASEPRNRFYLAPSYYIDSDYIAHLNINDFKSLNPQVENFEINSNSSNNLSSLIVKPKNGIVAFCDNFLKVAHLKRLTHIFYHYGNKIRELDNQRSDKIEITLLTALTLDRIASLEKMLTHWKGPAAVLFYLTDWEASYQLPKLLSSSSVFTNKKVSERIAMHLVFKTSTFNPINYLRNVLLNNSMTSHSVYIDVDLVPNQGIYESIQKSLKNYKDPKLSDRLFIIPAFEAISSLENNFPKNKTEILELIKKNIVSGYEVGVKKAKGHQSTNYDKWVKTNTTYEAQYVRFYEPYAVVPRSVSARFNEDLIERMQDKIAYVRTLRAMGFKFYVLPNDFIIHLPHPPSHGRKIFHADPRFMKCDRLMNDKHGVLLNKLYPKAKI